MGTWGQAGKVAIDVTVLFAPHVFPGAAFCQVGKRGVHGDSLNLWVTLSPLLPGSWCQVLQLRGFSPRSGGRGACLGDGAGGRGAQVREGGAAASGPRPDLGSHLAAWQPFCGSSGTQAGPCRCGSPELVKNRPHARTHAPHARTHRAVRPQVGAPSVNLARETVDTIFPEVKDTPVFSDTSC